MRAAGYPLVVLLALGGPLAAGHGHAGENGEGVTAAVLGRSANTFHPFLSAGSVYTDNLYNTARGAESDMALRFSPGFYLALPGIKEELAGIDTSSFAAGGLAFDFERPRTFRRYQAYLLAGADLLRWADHDSEDTTDYRLEGMLRLNLRGGMSVNLADQYRRGHDPRGTGISERLDEFETNLAALSVTHDFSSKFAARVDASRFDVDYHEARNDYRDRVDHGLAAYLYYKLSSRTALFTEYRWLDIGYQPGGGVDSAEHHVYGGLRWRLSEKSRGELKAGWANKSFDGAGAADTSDFVLALTAVHDLSEKTSLALTAARRLSEPDIPSADFTRVHSLDASLSQRLTGRVGARLSAGVSATDYDGPLTWAGETKERSDLVWSVGPGIDFQMRRWLTAWLSYRYSSRESNFADFDYTSNSLTAGLDAKF